MRKKIVRLEDLPEGTTKRFSFQRDGMRVDAFVANFKGDIVAYENRCRHLPITLDYGQTHGAFYEPKTGLCIDGPCTGASLIPLETELSDGHIFLVR